MTVDELMSLNNEELVAAFLTETLEHQKDLLYLEMLIEVFKSVYHVADTEMEHWKLKAMEIRDAILEERSRK
jgi:homospermidine synthase